MVRVELCCSAIANPPTPESPILAPERSRVVREELCCSAVASASAPESPMKWDDRSRVVRVGSFERRRERGISSRKEEEEAGVAIVV